MQSVNISHRDVAQQMALDVLNIFWLGAVNVAGNVQVKLVGFNLVNRYHSAEFFYFSLFVEHIHDLVNVLLTQAVLIAVLYKAPRCVDHKNAFAVVGVFLVQDNDTGRNARSVEQVGWQADDTFDIAAADDVGADFGLSITAKQHTMRQNARPFALAFQ